MRSHDYILVALRGAAVVLVVLFLLLASDTFYEWATGWERRRDLWRHSRGRRKQERALTRIAFTPKSLAVAKLLCVCEPYLSVKSHLRPPPVFDWKLRLRGYRRWKEFLRYPVSDHVTTYWVYYCPGCGLRLSEGPSGGGINVVCHSCKTNYGDLPGNEYYL